MKSISYQQLVENCGDPIVIISHPRSGTHLTIDLLRKQFKECASYKWPLEPQHFLYLSIEGFLTKNMHKRLKEETAFKIVRRPQRPIIKLHTYSWDILHEKYSEWMRWLDDYGKVIHVSRDLRSVLISLYFYVKTHDKIANVPFSEFIRQPVWKYTSRPAYWKKMMDFWQKKDSIYQLDFDSLIYNTEEELANLGAFLDLKPLLRKPILPSKMESLWLFRLQRLYAINPESTAILGAKNSKKIEYSEKDLLFISKEIGTC